MPSRLGAALAAALSVPLATTPAVAACVSPDEIIGRIGAEVPTAQVRTVEGAAADRITAGIIALTGSQMAQGGSYVLADLPDAVLIYVVRIAEGCATHHGRFPRRLMRIWINGQLAEP